MKHTWPQNQEIIHSNLLPSEELIFEDTGSWDQNATDILDLMFSFGYWATRVQSLRKFQWSLTHKTYPLMKENLHLLPRWSSWIQKIPSVCLPLQWSDLFSIRWDAKCHFQKSKSSHSKTFHYWCESGNRCLISFRESSEARASTRGYECFSPSPLMIVTFLTHSHLHCRL